MGQGELALYRDVVTETVIFMSLPRGRILQDAIIHFFQLVEQDELELLTDVATELLMFISLPRGLILQVLIIQFGG